MSEIYSMNTSDKLLACLLQQPQLTLEPSYKLDKDEFNPCMLHKICYVVIYNLALNGYKNITPMDFEQYLKNYESQYNVFLDNNGISYLQTICELTDIDNTQAYYDEFKKLSCLRAYNDIGYPIKEFWDFEKSDGKNLENVNKYSIEDIVDYFEKLQADICDFYKFDNNIEEMIAGDGFDELLDEFEQDPMIGGGMCSPIINNLYRGRVEGHLILRGSPSSFGKTTMGIADDVNVGILKVWSDEQNCYIDNPYYQGKTAYIHTEQKMQEEIQPRIMATISHIPYHKILDGDFTEEEKERLKIAGEIAKESQFKLINYPNFTAMGLKDKIKKLALDGYKYITFDYIWNNFYIVAELKKMNGNNAVREDQALLNVANVLKMSAEEFDVSISTMIQLNGREKEVEIVDETCLYGSKSVKTKLDNGSIYMYPKQKELKQVEMLIEKWNKKYNKQSFGGTIVPNAISHCFKTRYGRYGQNIKVWHYVDNSIGKMIDMFATTWDNKPIDIQPLYIETK